jgi:hypothetical protein
MLYKVEIYDFEDVHDVDDPVLQEAQSPDIVFAVIDLAEVSHLIEVLKDKRINKSIPETKFIMYNGYIIHACVTLKKATQEWQKFKDSQPITIEFLPNTNANEESEPNPGED